MLQYGLICVEYDTSNILVTYNIQMQDTKYLNLRKKLDSLKYTQTMHPTSVELVDRLLSDNLKLLDSLDKLQKKSVPISPSLNSDYLTTRNQQLLQQIELLKSKLSTGNVEEKITRLNNTLHEYKLNYDSKVQQYTSQITRLKEQNQRGKQELLFIEQEMNAARKSSKTNANEYEQYNNELTQLVDKKNKEIKEHEQLASKYRIKISILEKNVEEISLTKNSAKTEQNIQQTKMIEVLKNQLAENQKKIDMLKLNLDEQCKQNNSLKSQLRHKDEQLQSIKMDQNQSKSLSELTRHSKDKLESMYTTVCQSLEEKISEISSLQASLQSKQSQIEKLQKTLKDYSLKNKHLAQTSSNLQDEITQLSQKYTIQVKKTREIQAANHILQNKLKQQQQNILELTHLQPMNYSLSVTEIDRQKKDVLSWQRQIKLLKEELQSGKDQHHKTLLQKQKYLQENRRLQLIIQEGNKNVDLAQQQKQELMRELKSLRGEKESVHSSNYSYKNELMLLKQQIQSYEAQITTLKGQINKSHHSNELLNTQLTKLSTQLVKSQTANKEIFQDNKMMASQIKLLDAKKAELLEKLKSTNQKQQQSFKGSIEYKKQYDALMSKHDDLLKELANKERSIIVIDNERDTIQNQLDRKTEEYEQLKSMLSRIQKEQNSQNRGQTERQVAYNGLMKKCETIESQYASLQRDYKGIYQQSNELKRMNNSLQGKVRQLQNQLSLLLLGKNENVREMQRNRNKVVQLERKLKERLKECDEERQKAVSLSIMNGELHEQLQNERIQINRMKGLIQQYQAENNNMYYHLQNKDTQLTELHHLIQDYERKEPQLMHQIDTYQRQLQQTTQDCERLIQEIDTIKNQRDAYRVQNLRSNQTGDYRTVMEEKVWKMQQDYQAKKRENQALRSQVRQLENVLAQERIKYCGLQQKIIRQKGAQFIRQHRPSNSLHSNSIHSNSIHSNSINPNVSQANMTKSKMLNTVSIRGPQSEQLLQDQSVSLMHRCLDESYSQKESLLLKEDSVKDITDKLDRLEEEYMKMTVPNLR